jgi:hypothetical protein
MAENRSDKPASSSTTGSNATHTGSNASHTEHQEDMKEKVTETLKNTGERVSEELNAAGEKVKNFVEEKRLNEQFEVAGGQVVERVRDLIEEGNVRRLILRNSDGRTLLEIPLTAGVAVGGAVLWLNPIMAGLGAIAALVARVTIEIVREEPDATVQDIKRKVDNAKDKISGDK